MHRSDASSTPHDYVPRASKIYIKKSESRDAMDGRPGPHASCSIPSREQLLVELAMSEIEKLNGEQPQRTNETATISDTTL